MSTLQEMRDLISNGMKTGTFANIKELVGSKLIALGADPKDVQKLLGGNPNDYQAFGKLAIQLTSQGVQNLGANQAASVFGQFHQAYPSIESNPDTLDLMTNTMGMLAKREQDRCDFVQQAWVKGGHTGDAELQAESDFDKSSPAANYIHAGEAQSKAYYQHAWPSDKAKQRAILSLIPVGSTYYRPDGVQVTRTAPAAAPGTP